VVSSNLKNDLVEGLISSDTISDASANSARSTTSMGIQADGSIRTKSQQTTTTTSSSSTSSTIQAQIKESKITKAVVSDYKSFLNSSLAQRPLRGEYIKSSTSGVQGEQQPINTLHISWYAPFFSGGGYCSEATSFVLGMQPSTTSASTTKPRSSSVDMDVTAGSSFGGIEYSLSIVQHGDGMNTNYLFGLDPSAYSTLQTLAAKTPRNRKRVLSICHSEPGAWTVSSKLPARYSTSQCPSHGSAYSIGRTMFETDRLPSGWAERLNGMDEVWVPSNFMKTVCVEGGVDTEKVLIVPEPVDTDFFRPIKIQSDPTTGGRTEKGSFKPLAPPLTHIRSRKCIDANGKGVPIGSSLDCPFRFLTIGKWERRKGFDVLLRSYLTAFMDKTSLSGSVSTVPFVELYMLTSAYHSSGDFHAALDKMVRSDITCGHPNNNKAPLENRNICIPPQPTPSSKSLSQAAAFLSSLPPIHLLTNIPQTSLPSIYASVDCVVQPSRGEGWGRPHVEAMSMELPLVATSWSGPSEFMTDENSYSIKILKDLIPIPDGAFAGHLQAEPDALHLKELLLHVVQSQDEAKTKGKKARSDMIKLYHPRKLAAFLNIHFERIQEIVLAIEADEVRQKTETAKAQAANSAQMKAIEIEKKRRVEAESAIAETRLEAARKEAAARVANALAELRKVEEEESELSEKRKLESDTNKVSETSATPATASNTPLPSISISSSVTATLIPSPTQSKSVATASSIVVTASASAVITVSPTSTSTSVSIPSLEKSIATSEEIDSLTSESVTQTVLDTSVVPSVIYTPLSTPSPSQTQTPTKVLPQVTAVQMDEDRAELERRALLRAQQIANELRQAQNAGNG
jgi:glycosyltransferase involved in cell wall biosynthesis